MDKIDGDGIYIMVDVDEFIVETLQTGYTPLIITIDQAKWLIEKLTEQIKKMQGDND
jgi:hypothetical protein